MPADQSVDDALTCKEEEEKNVKKGRNLPHFDLPEERERERERAEKELGWLKKPWQMRPIPGTFLLLLLPKERLVGSKEEGGEHFISQKKSGEKR